MLSRKGFVKALSSFVSEACCQIGSSVAQPRDEYPSQVIRLIIPFAPGGLPDTIVRIIAPSLQARLKPSVVVENRLGSGGGVAATAVANAPGDGYQLIVTDNSFLSIDPYLYKQLAYNPKDFVTVAQIATALLFLAVHPNIPV